MTQGTFSKNVKMTWIPVLVEQNLNQSNRLEIQVSSSNNKHTTQPEGGLPVVEIVENFQSWIEQLLKQCWPPFLDPNCKIRMKIFRTGAGNGPYFYFMLFTV